jgi:hypothetical protein
MKYQLIGENDFLNNPIETVLHNRGIQDIKKFLKPSRDNEIHYSKLININKALETIIRHIEKGGELFIQVDSDP